MTLIVTVGEIAKHVNQTGVRIYMWRVPSRVETEFLTGVKNTNFIFFIWNTLERLEWNKQAEALFHARIIHQYIVHYNNTTKLSSL